MDEQLETHRTIRDASRFVLPGLALTVLAATLAAGALLYQSLSNSKMESRHDAIKRMADDPLGTKKPKPDPRETESAPPARDAAR